MATIDRTAIVAALEKFYDDIKSIEIVGMDPFDLGPDLDSLLASGVLANLEPIVGLGDLPLTLVKRGGYTSKEDFVADFSNRLENYAASLG